MDHEWERSVPFYSIDLGTAAELFRRFHASLKPIRIEPLTEGKRTTNYRVSAGNGEFVLRIYPAGDDSWRKEAAIREALGGQVPLQRLWYADRHERLGGRAYAILEFVRGETLLRMLLDQRQAGGRFFSELGETLARIHRIRYPQVGLLDEQLELAMPFTPVADWYSFFLKGRAGSRIGSAIVERILRLTEEWGDALEEMDRHASLVHGDFRPANLLVREGSVSCLLDWEFVMAGHPLADIGQLLRYKDAFLPSDIRAFAASYQDLSDAALPERWESLALLRDLIHLLQMLSADEELPVKYAELKGLIAGTLRILERRNFP